MGLFKAVARLGVKRALSAAAASTVVIGAIGGALIQSSEGKVNKAYRDPVGIVTICYGHTGPDVSMGMEWSDEKCEATFLEDVAKHQTPIIGPKNCIGDAPLTYNQRDAVTSFIFNIGNAKFCRSTMAAKLKARDYTGAANEFPKWKYAGGKVLRGLEIRRAKERELFLSSEAWTPYIVKSTVAWENN